ncbi:SIMPL domain-containing protein [Alishewanella jeotgali]|uniref:SIMPL domain-containing protein n=1 Tax=Alishewanella jeotgali KCTC 22429 TaxID=1129374 RepID=H3ZIA5_9ALTE|nr:SIMPL domain-containing protein [Alishewanella jeotgali]EHR39747.1 hypothetical protein AJE_15579 [Alishewanella jeotgali KCTC 22429]
MLRLTTAFSLLVAAASVTASPLPDFPFINVTGQATLEVAPDKAQIRFVLRQTGATAEQATRAVYQQGESLLKFLQTQGLTEKALDAAQINKEALYKDYQDRTITGYEASQPITLTLTNLEQYVTVMDYLFTQPQIFSIHSSFDHSKREEFELTLSEKAGADARARANRLAAAQGVKLSTVFAITENAGFGNLAGDFGFGGGQVSYGRLEKMSADSGMAGALLAPKQITLQKSVNVIYKLNP